MFNLAAVKLDSDILNAHRDQSSALRGNVNTPKTLQTGHSDETWASPRSRGHSAKSNKSLDLVAVSVKTLEPLVSECMYSGIVDVC